MIYIACPSRIATGGTEVLHQIYFQLSKLTPNVKIFYYDYDGIACPVANRFNKYTPEWVTKIIDDKDNILIVPETNLGIELLNRHSNINKIIYWGSVDNYLLSNGIGLFKHSYSQKGFTYLIKVLISRALNSIIAREKKSLVDFNESGIIHLYQSYYAKTFLISKGVRSLYPISDYIDEELTIEVVNFDREDILLYNPGKGYKFTKKVIKNLKTLKATPIINLDTKDLKYIYSKSKIYIDFGYHPGKDRIPREAVCSGNLLITNVRGSACNNVDIPIPNEYKIDDSKMSAKKIAYLIEHISQDYKLRIKDFDNYRKQILQEKLNFINEVGYLFKSELKKYAK
jgi:hypothetical protein